MYQINRSSDAFDSGDSSKISVTDLGALRALLTGHLPSIELRPRFEFVRANKGALEKLTRTIDLTKSSQVEEDLKMLAEIWDDPRWTCPISLGFGDNAELSDAEKMEWGSIWEGNLRQLESILGAALKADPELTGAFLETRDFCRKQKINARSGIRGILQQVAQRSTPHSSFAISLDIAIYTVAVQEGSETASRVIDHIRDHILLRAREFGLNFKDASLLDQLALSDSVAHSLRALARIYKFGYENWTDLIDELIGVIGSSLEEVDPESETIFEDIRAVSSICRTMADLLMQKRNDSVPFDDFVLPRFLRCESPAKGLMLLGFIESFAAANRVSTGWEESLFPLDRDRLELTLTLMGAFLPLVTPSQVMVDGLNRLRPRAKELGLSGKLDKAIKSYRIIPEANQ